MSKKALSELFKRWVNRGRRVTTPVDAHTRARLRLEEVEHRVVPATLPPVTVTDTREMLAGAFAPQAVADPTNPNTIAVVSASTSSSQFAELFGRISRDGGQTWSSFPIPNETAGQFGGPGGSTLTNVNTPSVAFSRTGELYVAWTHTTADATTAGRVLTSSFTVSRTTPDTGSGVTLLNGPVVLYEWLNQDPVFNPTIAVDNNVDQYTDPDTGAVTAQDTMLGATGAGKAVYVAWNTNARTPTIVGHTTIPPAGIAFTPTAIFAAASRDQGASYSTPVPVNNGGFFNPGSGGVAPRIVFTPGDLNANTADVSGRLQFVWSGTGGSTRIDTTQPDQGVLNQEVVASYQVSGAPTFIAEAIVPASGPHLPGVTTSTATVAITDPAFTTLSDIDVTLAITHPHVNQLRIFLVPPLSTGVGRIQLLESEIDGAGADRRGQNPPASFARFGLADNSDTSGRSGIGVSSLPGFAVATGTTFDDEAARLINDRTNTAPYIAHFRPEFGSLSNLYGLDVADLQGDWTLEIQDVRDDDGNAGANSFQFLNSWSIHMSSQISNGGFGSDDFVDTFGVAGSAANLGGTGASNATALGFGAGVSVAYDTTQGSFSPHGGRMYVAYTATANGGDVRLIYSDDQGQTWSDPVTVNDDDVTDNVTEGTRTQFMPSVTVDPVTGTVVVMWYDARWDASNARVTTYMATSIDGGDSFSVQDLDAYLNPNKTAVDQLTRQTVRLEPLPTNLRAAGASEAGQRQSVLAYGGEVKPFWTGNLNANGASVYTASVVTAAGPRVISSDMGAVTADAGYGEVQVIDVTGTTGSFRLTFNNGTTSATTGTIPFGASATTVENALNGLATIGPDSTVTVTRQFTASGDRYTVTFATGPLSTRNVLPITGTGTGDVAVSVTTLQEGRAYNSTFAADGTRLLDGFRVTFDRAIDVSTFDPSDVTVLFRAPGTTRDTSVPPTRIPVGAVIPIDPVATFPGQPDNATSFFVQYATPQSSVGTYSYSVGPAVGDRVRTGDRVATFASTGTPAELPSPGTYDSTIVVPALSGNPVVEQLRVTVNITHDSVGDLRLTLYGPDPDGPGPQLPLAVVLSDQNGGFGSDFSRTQFDDNPLRPGSQPITSPFAGPPYTGFFVPQQPLSSFVTTPLAGAWTLRVEDLQGNQATSFNGPATLDSWTIDFLDANGDPLVVRQDGTRQDQDTDAKTGEVGTNFNPNIAASAQAPRLYTDAYNVPGVIGPDKFNADPFALRVNPDTLPLVSPGPHLVDTSVPSNPLATDNLVLNGTANQLDVTFDRDINPATFTTANILRMTGPAGVITPRQDITVTGPATGSFTVTVTTPTGTQTTTILPVGIPAAGGTGPVGSLENALEALANVGAGNVRVVAYPGLNGATVYQVRFTGSLANVPLPGVTAAGADGATAAVAAQTFSVVPLGGASAAGGYRTFRITFPVQNLSGPYAIEFGLDPLGNAIRAVNVPELVARVTPATSHTQLTVTFDRDIANGEFTTADIERVLGPNGVVPGGQIAGVTRVDARTFTINFSTPLPDGQYVVAFNPARNLRVAGSGAAIDMNFNAGLDVLRGDAEFSDDLQARQFASTGAVPIDPATDPGTGTLTPSVSESSIVVTEDFIIRQSNLELIQLLMNIQHPDVRDLDIELVPPAATGVGPIRLFTGGLATQAVPGSSANFVNTRLIDRVGDPNVANIQLASPPFNPGAGRFFSPQTPLSALVGKSALGVWTLRVINRDDNSSTGDPNSPPAGQIQITDWALTLPKAITSQNLTFTTPLAAPILPADTTPTVTDSAIQVPINYVIQETDLQKIQLLLNISHPYVRDLNIDLIPPAATGVGAIRLFTGSQLAPSPANATANFTNTRLSNRLNDPNVPNIQTARPPFNAGADGSFAPQTALTPLVGKSTLGTWTLRVTNTGDNNNPPTTDPNFDANTPVAIQNWSLTLPRLVATTGLGEETADRFQAGFRIFTQDPTNPLSQQVWTPVGPVTTNETANSARVTAVVADPSDPTGNTVYVTVAGGGVWKTTDFLNPGRDAAGIPTGPHYVPLTDFGPTSAVNVSSLAVFPRNNDPNQTIVFALTGEANTASSGVYADQFAGRGVGVLRSMDGGKTWQVLDSTVNVDASGNVVPMSDPTRQHEFVGSAGYKIVVDPSPGKDGGVIVYMAISGGPAPGLYRSLDTGNHWTLIQAGNATDVVLAAGSANPTSGGATVFQGNLQRLYAAFRTTTNPNGPGVYRSDTAPAAAGLTFMAGGTNNPLIVDIENGLRISTQLPLSNPNGRNARISLTVPALTGDPLKDSLLQDWLYAMTTDPNGATQLYVTKDAGAHWTRVRVPNTTQFFTPPVNGTNNESTTVFNPNQSLSPRAQVDVGTFGGYNMTLAVDPQNPNIVYMAGSGDNSIRLDLTTIRDGHNWTFFNNSDVVLGTPPTAPATANDPADNVANAANPAFTTQVNNLNGTTGGVQPPFFIVAPATTAAPPHGYVYIGGSNTEVYQDANGDPLDFLNLFRDYNQPFLTNSTLRVGGFEIYNYSPIFPDAFFVNDGADVQWTPFTDVFDTGLPVTSLRTQNRFPGSNIHTVFTMIDPVTHNTRLIFGTDDGVFTGVDAQQMRGSGTLSTGIGFSDVVNFNRNGNLQVSQLYNGAVQPSQLAADLAGALFYAMGDGSGFTVSSADMLATGDGNWRGPTGEGVAVLTDPTGTGTAFQYRGTTGFDLNTTSTSLDFFRVLPNTSLHSFGGGIGRTGGASGDNLFPAGEFWPTNTLIQPAVSPFDPNNPTGVLLIGSATGRVYRTTNQGLTWQQVSQVGELGNAQINVVAFGSSDPAEPTLTNNFLYAGTQGGQIWSTTTGGTPWLNISAGLTGQQVLRILPNPARGKKDLFALTTDGVFYKADGTTTGPWQNITGSLFNLTRPVFDNPDDTVPALRANGLTSLVADWRFTIPDQTDPNLTFPILYVGGDGGVFQSKDFGATWVFYPSVAGDGAPVEGGYLPNTHVTDLDLSIGDYDPVSGTFKPGGLNMLVATTYGRGQFAIRLDDTLPPESFISGPRVTSLINPNPPGGPSDRLRVQFSGPVDPATFTPADVHLVGPNGVDIPITGVTMVSVPDANGLNPRDLFEISFAPQSVVGTYQLTVGYNPPTNVPRISDPSGFLMNQDADTTNGEPLVDQFQSSITLNAATNNALVVTSYPVTATAGVAGSVTIVARDANGNPLAANGTLTLTAGSPGTGTFFPTTVTMTNGTATFDITFQTAGPQTVSVTFTGSPAVNPTSWTTVVSAAAASQLVISPASSTVTAPATQSFTITAQDQFGNTADSFDGSVSLSATGTGVILSTDTVAMSAGVGSFSADFQSTGTVQISATAPGLTTGTATVTVVSGAATQLVVTAPPGPFVVGQPVPVTVQALDAAGNPATNVDGQAVTVTVQPGGSATVSPASPVFVNGQASFTVTFTAAGTFTVTGTAGSLSGTSGPISIGSAPPPPSPTTNLTGVFAVGTGVGGTPVLSVFNPDGSPRTQVIPFPPGYNNEVDPTSAGFTGGTRVAVADVTGDGVPDYVVGTGPTITAFVEVIDGATNQSVLHYQPFDGFQGGVFVAVGDINKDGVSEIVITPDEGGGPRVVILNGRTFDRIGNFFGIADPDFRGGARAGVGDLNGDGFADLVVSAGFGGGPRISVFDGAALAQGRQFHPVGDFFLFEPELRNGAYVAVGDVNGDGFGDIIGGAGPGGGPRVLMISGKTMLSSSPVAALAAPIANFFAGDVNNRGGIRVATKNLDGDRFTDLVVGAGDGGGSLVTAYRGSSLANGSADALYSFDALPGYFGGVFVG